MPKYVSPQISGKGFTGTYRLCHPYYPSPRELWGKDFVEPKSPKEPRAAKAEPSPKYVSLNFPCVVKSHTERLGTTLETIVKAQVNE